MKMSTEITRSLPLLVKIPDTARELSTSISSIYELVEAGKLDLVKLGPVLCITGELILRVLAQRDKPAADIPNLKQYKKGVQPPLPAEEIQSFACVAKRGGHEIPWARSRLLIPKGPTRPRDERSFLLCFKYCLPIPVSIRLTVTHAAASTASVPGTTRPRRRSRRRVCPVIPSSVSTTRPKRLRRLTSPLSMVSAAKLLLKQQDCDLIDVVLFGGEFLMKMAGEIRRRDRQVKASASDVSKIRILAVR